MKAATVSWYPPSLSSTFAQTKIIHRGVLTALPMPNLKKILVIGVLENYLVRQEFALERATAADIDESSTIARPKTQ
jgi:hypothetical protein